MSEPLPAAGAGELLTTREFEVLVGLGEGLTVTQLAARHGLSVKTVSTYRQRVLQKLTDAKVIQTWSTNALMRYALQNGLVP